MLPGPLLPMLAPLLIAAVAAITGRWPRIAAAAGLVGVLVIERQLSGLAGDTGQGWFSGTTWVLPVGNLFLTDETAYVLQLIYLAVAILLGLAILWPQSDAFVPAAVATLAPLAALLLFEPLAFRMLALFLVAALSTTLMQGGQAGATRGALRYLAFTLIALPLFLVAAWIIGAGGQGLVVTTGRLLVIGLLILLAGFPFYLWVTPVVTGAAPLALPYLFGIVQLLLVLFSRELVNLYPAALSQESVLQLLRWSGGITILIGALLAFQAPTRRQVLGYALLLDLGATLALLAEPAAPLLDEALVLLLVFRFVSLLLAGVGLTVLESGRQTRVLGIVLFTYGLFSLAGVPLMPGFGGRWLSTIALAESSVWLAAVVIVAISSIVVGTSRFIFQEVHETESTRERAGSGQRPPERIIPYATGPLRWIVHIEKQLEIPAQRLKFAALALLVGTALYLTFFPQSLVERVQQLVSMLQ